MPTPDTPEAAPRCARCGNACPFCDPALPEPLSDTLVARLEQVFEQCAREVEEEEAIIEWVKSDEGRAAIEEGVRKTKAMSLELRKAQKLSWEQLHRPMDI